jgi:hypothetical protein
LVVIAIIAILAAILFPVFAQAKVAAKNAASLSNLKQINLAVIMYTNDYDDTFPIAVNATTGGTDITWEDWPRTILPYQKTFDLDYSPLGGPKAVTSWMTIFTNPGYNWIGNWQYFAQYGMNATYLNPAPNCNAIQQSPPSSAGGVNQFGYPVTTTSFAQPASTIAFTDAGQDSPQDNVGTHIVYPPGGIQSPNICTYGDWGPATGVWYGLGGSTLKTQAGFVRPRAPGGAVTAFVDGHTKIYQLGALAAGTNWYYGQAYGTALIIDYTRYLWDPQ